LFTDPFGSHLGISFTALQETLENEHIPPPTFQQDDIRTEYHPCSGITTKIDHFSDFCRNTAARSEVPENITPWEPFSSHIDFDFAELVLKANLMKLQTDELISLIRRTAFEQFSVTDYDGIGKMWDAASPRHAKVSLQNSMTCYASLTIIFQAQFKKEVISVPHRDQEHNFDVWYRPLWDWACDLLKDPRLSPHFMFDAQCLYQYDGQDRAFF